MSAIIDRYRENADGFLARLEATPADRWTAVSPCAGWNARDVVSHVVSSHRWIIETASSDHFTPPGEASRRTIDDADLAKAFVECRDGMVAVLSDPATAGRMFPAPIGLVPFERSCA